MPEMRNGGNYVPRDNVVNDVAYLSEGCPPIHAF